MVSGVNFAADALSPLPPVVIEPVPLNESAIRVRWNRPQTEEPIVRYSMRYNALSSEQADWPDANILTRWAHTHSHNIC